MFIIHVYKMLKSLSFCKAPLILLPLWQASDVTDNTLLGSLVHRLEIVASRTLHRTLVVLTHLDFPCISHQLEYTHRRAQVCSHSSPRSARERPAAVRCVWLTWITQLSIARRNAGPSPSAALPTALWHPVNFWGCVNGSAQCLQDNEDTRMNWRDVGL